MKVYPVDQSDVILISTIDPGTTCLGLSRFYFNYRTIKIEDIDSQTYTGIKLPDFSLENVDIHGALFARLIAYKKLLTNLFMEDRPSVVVSESPFFVRTQPGAYGPLSKMMYLIEESVYEYDPLVKFITIPPSNVKKAVNAGAHCGKDSMKNAVREIAAIQKVLRQDYESLDEHSIDSLAVGWAFFNEYLIKKQEVTKC